MLAEIGIQVVQLINVHLFYLFMILLNIMI